MNFLEDDFKKNRGGYSRILEIRCSSCGQFVCYYQKDGPGNLRRLYLDRMFSHHTDLKNTSLTCKNQHILGIKINYEKENRPAYRLFVDAIERKIISKKKIGANI